MHKKLCSGAQFLVHISMLSSFINPSHLIVFSSIKKIILRQIFRNTYKSSLYEDLRNDKYILNIALLKKHFFWHERC